MRMSYFVLRWFLRVWGISSYDFGQRGHEVFHPTIFCGHEVFHPTFFGRRGHEVLRPTIFCGHEVFHPTILRAWGISSDDFSRHETLRPTTFWGYISAHWNVLQMLDIIVIVLISRLIFIHKTFKYFFKFNFFIQFSVRRNNWWKNQIKLNKSLKGLNLLCNFMNEN